MKKILLTSALALYSTLGFTADMAAISGNGETDITRDFLRWNRGGSLKQAVLFAILFFLFWKAADAVRFVKRTASHHWLTIALAAFSAFWALIGRTLDETQSFAGLRGGIPQYLRALFVFGGYFAFFFALIHIIYRAFEAETIRRLLQAPRRPAWLPRVVVMPVVWYLRGIRKHTFTVVLLTVLLLNIPNIVLSYPATFMGDTRFQIRQLFERPDGSVLLSNHHPIAHTALIHACLVIAHGLWSSWNRGIFLYCLVQIAFFSLAVSYMMSVLIRESAASPYSILFYALYLVFHPRIQGYLMLVTKDVPYTAMLIIFCVSLFRLQLGRRTRPVYASLLTSGIGMMLMRNEGLYILLPTLLFSIRREHARKVVGITAALIVFWLIWNHGIIPALGVTTEGHKEMLSIPIQQVARTFRDDGESITEEERRAIGRVLPCESLAELYNPLISDPVKLRFHPTEMEEDERAFLLAWLEMLKKHPGIYLEALLSFKYQYFYCSNDIRNYFNFSWSERCITEANKLGRVYRIKFAYPKKLQNARLQYEELRESIARIPIIKFVLTSGFYIQALFIWGIYLLMTGNRRMYPFLLLMLMLILTMIAGPTNGYYFRYTYPAAVCLPFLLLAGKRLRNCP